MTDQLKGFIFNGLLAKHAVKDMQSSGIVHTPEAAETQRAETDLFASVQERIRTNSVQMQYAFRLLFVLENTVRELITSRFSEADGTTWFDIRATAPMKGRFRADAKRSRRINGMRAATKTQSTIWTSVTLQN